MATVLSLETNDVSKSLIIKDIQVSISDIKVKNPYNTIAKIEVISGCFCGKCMVDFDFCAFKKFSENLKEMSHFSKRTASLKSVTGDSLITFTLDAHGNLSVEGKLMDYSSHQSLNFSFQTDQTALESISKSLVKSIEMVNALEEGLGFVLI